MKLIDKFDWKDMVNVDLPRCSNYFKYDSDKGKWLGDDIWYELNNNIIRKRPLP